MNPLDLNPLTSLSVVYATDEHIAIAASGDYAELVPDYAVVSRGEDGMFTGSPDWWTLTSPTGQFDLAGVQPGQVVHLDDAPGGVIAVDGEDFAVHASTATTITLRRIGMQPGQGQPPTRIVASSIEWSILTFGTQLESVSFDLNRRFRIDPLSQFWTPANLADRRQLRQACVMGVLLDQYTTNARSKDADWTIKRNQVKSDMEDLERRLAIGWGPAVGIEPPTTISRMRIIR